MSQLHSLLASYMLSIDIRHISSGRKIQQIICNFLLFDASRRVEHTRTWVLSCVRHSFHTLWWCTAIRNWQL